MNLMTGLLRPDRGAVSVCGVASGDAEALHRVVGYCPQWDTFPAAATGRSFLADCLACRGLARGAAAARSEEVLHRVGLTEAGGRRVAGYSKGMRQRLKLGQALAHEPPVLILDEPLNGLDPVGRAAFATLLSELAAEGRHVVVSTHILHDVDAIADTVVMVHGGQVVAEGAIREVRRELVDRPVQVLVRCDRPRLLAARAFTLEHVVEARLLESESAVLVSTRDGDAFFAGLADIVLADGIDVETVLPADENVRSVYEYLIGGEGGSP
jgi:ABC-2 type transport system ATP-binding protein